MKRPLPRTTSRPRALPMTAPGLAATYRQVRYRATIAVGDAVVLVIASVVAGARAGWPKTIDHSDWPFLDDASLPVVAAVVVAFWLVLLAMSDGYSRRKLLSGTEEYKAVLVASVGTAGVLSMTSYLSASTLPRAYFGALFVTGLPLLLVWRVLARQAVRAMRRRGSYVSLTVVVGTRKAVAHVLQVLRRERWAGYLVHGVVLTDDQESADLEGIPVVGTTTSIAADVGRIGTQTLILGAGAGPGSPGFTRLLWQLDDTDVEVVVAPGFVDVAGPRIRVRPVAGLPLLTLRMPEFSGPQRVLKRGLGLVVSALLLLLLSPVFLAIATAVKRSSPGPVFFTQTRVGKDEREFSCLKFRTMYVDAEARLVELQAEDEGNGLLFKIRDDPRVTSVGRFLRRFSLDELPQLVNVLRGEMALVGPRPPLPSEVAQYTDDLHRRLLVPPGMTGLWQVSGRSDLSLEESKRLDLYYIDNWSLLHDLEIVAKTVRAVVGGRGAY